MAKKQVAILGMGPTAIFAARAACDMRADVTIFCVDPKMVKTPPGAFWLHWIPPMFKDKYPAERIEITSDGTAEEYTKRQWANVINAHNVSSSFPTDTVVEYGYSPEMVLMSLLPFEARFEITKKYLTVQEIDRIANVYDFTFQTFPYKEHFKEQPDLLPFVAAAWFNSRVGCANEVWYNGTPNGIVVREATLFGHHFLEFPKAMALEETQHRYAVPDLVNYAMLTLRDLHPASKVMTHPNPRITLLGRMAMWDRKFLSHDAYKKVKEVMGNGIS